MFLDLGWTLVDETGAHLQRLEELQRMTPGGFDISADAFLASCERHASRFADSPFWAAVADLSPESAATSRESVRYDHSLERLYPGVEDLLERLQSFYHLGLIANQSAGARDRLNRFGIGRVFAVILCSAELGLSKPDARIFARAAGLARCSAAEATMVGDRLDNDIGPARSCGWRAIRVLQGFWKKQAARNPGETPDHTIAAIADLSEL
jgi:FMN phosphatase YigB (HAD superfamily)